MKLFFQLAILLVFIVGPQLAQAQHVHSIPHTTTHYDTVRHGHHFHVVPHTTTHYHNVLHYGPDYPSYASYSSYPSTSYPTTSYPAYASSSPYVTPTYNSIPISGSVVTTSAALAGISAITSSAPQPVVATAASSVTPIAALKPNTLPYQGPGVRIVLPREVGGEINYLIDGNQEAKIQSGQENVLSRKGSYEIRFSRGESDQGVDFGNARYTISEGTYRFAVTKNGWELFREPDSKNESAPARAELNLKKNLLPASKPPVLPSE